MFVGRQCFLTCHLSFVARFVLSLENDLTVRAKTTEVAVKDFSSGSYATIFSDEVTLHFRIICF